MSVEWSEVLGGLEPGKFDALLKPGSYRVHAGCLGYADQTIENLVVEQGGRTAVTLTLGTE